MYLIDVVILIVKRLKKVNTVQMLLIIL